MSSSAFSLPGPSGSTSSTPAKQLRALVSQAQEGDVSQLYALAASLEQTQLLPSIIAASHAADEEEELIISSTLSRLSKLTTSHLAQPPYAGAKLAVLQLRAEPASADAQPWASTAIAALLQLAERGAKAAQRRESARGRPLVELLLLADQLLGKPSRADERAEYKRAVVTPALPRFATALVGILECMVEDGSGEERLPILDALTLHLTAHPSSYRPHTPRLNKALHVLLYTRPLESAVGQAASVKLAAALHRTGASTRGKSTNNTAAATGSTDALWAATLAAPLTAARFAWSVASSAFAATQQVQQQENDAALFPTPLPSDPLEALEPALTRLELLLGDEVRTGVVPLLLAQGTVGHVSLPLEALLDLALRIISLGPAPAARTPAPDSTLLARQTAALPRAQAAALRLLGAVLLSVPRAALAQRAPSIVQTLLELLEHARTPPSLRSSTAATLALALSAQKLESGSANSLLGAALQLDPASALVPRTARICISHLARWIAHAAPAAAEAPSSTSSNRKKRARYESDALGLGSNPIARGLVALSNDDVKTADAVLQVLVALEPLLATELTPAHAALRRTYALLLLSLCTLALVPTSSNEELAATTLRALALLTRTSDGAMLTLLLARTAHLTTTALASNSSLVQNAARELALAAHGVLEPRLPPRLLRAPEERPAEWSVEEGDALGALKLAEDGTAGALLELGIFAKGAASLEMDEENGAQAHAQTQMAGVEQALPTSSPRSSAPHLPTHTHHAHHVGPRNSDPVKPTHRPRTPRIGSPASPERGTATNGGAASASPARAVFGLPGVASQLSTSSSSSTGTSAMIGVESTSTGAKETSKKALAAPASELPSVVIPEAKRSARTVQEEVDDDEEMPSIDLRGSDEEDEEEEEEEEEEEM